LPILIFSEPSHVSLIRAGEKQQSTRLPRKIPFKPYDKLFCYYKSRMKKGTCLNCINYSAEDQDCVKQVGCSYWGNFFGEAQVTGVIHCNSTLSKTTYKDYREAIIGKGFERYIASLGDQPELFMEGWAQADGFAGLNAAHEWFTKSTGTDQWMMRPWTIIIAGNFQQRTNMDLKEEILEFCKRGAVSFAEIENRFGKGTEGYGCQENSWYWFHLTKETVCAIHELFKEKKIIFYPSDPLVYLVDGIIPTYPIAKTGRKYKKDHWLPVVIWRTERIKNILPPRQAKIYRDAGWDI